MRIGLVGPSYEQRSLPFDAQRTINFFPIIDEKGRDPSALYSTAGLELFATAGAGPVRGGFKSGNGRVFFVSGTNLYEVDSAGSVTGRGSLLGSSGAVTMAEGTTQLAICDGDKLYSFTYSTDTFAIVSDPDLPSSVGYVTNIDGYFIVNENNTGRFYISTINDVTAWDALDFATAESSPDTLIAPVNGIGQLWLFGEVTTEIWTNTGASVFPFTRISGAVMQAGILAKNSALELDNTVFWLGQDRFGDGIVYRASGFSPRRISTDPIEKRIREATDAENIRGWSYQEEGHVFFVLTGGGLETSLVYDLSTQQWHERAYLNDDGMFEQHLGACHVFAFGKHLVGSRIDGKIYDMSLNYNDDDGEEIARERVYTHIFDESRRIRYNMLEVGIETGVGTVAGDNPKISLQLSRDGARTWSDWITANIGKIGEYQTKVRFRRLGVAEQMTFKVRCTDKVKTVITGSYLK